MKTLSLFNAVVAKSRNSEMFISEEGYIIEPDAVWAKDKIVKYYNEQKLTGNDLNKTFHKSWQKVRTSSRFSLYLDQIRHYMSTYGTNFQGEVYIPDEVLNIPEVKLTYKVIRAYTKEQMTEKCLGLLCSGIALKEETINDVLSVLTDELGYNFTGKEGVKNKEAIVKIADLYNVLPNDTMEFFRYIIYRATGESLLIKNPQVIQAIKDSNFNPSVQFQKFGLERLAEIFNRFKPLFLAFKSKCPSVINKISKLSKSCHKPLPVNALSLVTQRLLTKEDMHWLDNATPFALLKALNACWSRMNGQDTFVYRIRNGKSWVKSDHCAYGAVYERNADTIYNVLKVKFSLQGTKVFLPKDIEYAVPTSEKMFVGNIPTGTKFYGKKLAVGIYWKNSGGARDLDLSAVDVSGNKIGWNAGYSDDTLTYSGDITDAPNGAVEYLHSGKGLSRSQLIMNNVYSGDAECDYKIVVGKGSKVSQAYMMNPNKVFAEVQCKSVQSQTVLGMLLPGDKDQKQSFVLLNFGAGHCKVAGNNPQAINALTQQWTNPLSFNDLVRDLGAEIVDDASEADIDYSMDKLDKDSFTKLFV